VQAVILPSGAFAKANALSVIDRKEKFSRMNICPGKPAFSFSGILLSIQLWQILKSAMELFLIIPASIYQATD
jgi:hypothetical protein